MSESVDFIKEVLGALKRVVCSSEAPLHAPLFEGNERTYVNECLDSTFVSSVGKFVDRFEAQLAEFTGAKHAVAVVNGTAALQVALLLAGVRPGNEVLVPSLTFVATANAVTYCGAFPHFVDNDASTLGIDVDKLREYLCATTEQISGSCVNKKTGRLIRALVPMHTFGHIGNIEGMLDLAKDFRLQLVEDAAESLGSQYNGKHAGTFGLLGALSFNGNKIVTTGGGGALLTNDSELAARAKHITTTAKLQHPWKYLHDEVGFNYRMPNINAALGCAQLECLPRFLSDKRNLYSSYNREFFGLTGVSVFAEPANCRSNYWLQTLLLARENAGLRDNLLNEANSAGISTRPAWNLMHTLSPFLSSPRMDLSCAEDLARRIINIPSSANLGRIY